VRTDTQITELEGRAILERLLFAQGWEVAQPRRGNGIDLVAYRTNCGQFQAVPIQLKVSTKKCFEVHKKYSNVPGLRLVYVFLATEEIYPLTPKRLRFSRRRQRPGRRTDATAPRRWAQSFSRPSPPTRDGRFSRRSSSGPHGATDSPVDQLTSRETHAA